MTEKDPIGRLRSLQHQYGTDVNAIVRKIEAIADEIEEVYMRLPVDADGVPIRPGDEIEYDDPLYPKPRQCTVESVFEGCVFVDNALASLKACYCRHVKPDPVAEELARFLSACGDDDPHYYDEQIADYAERIRKAVQDGD